MLLEQHGRFPNKWAEIAKALPGRTDVDVAWGAELSGVDWSADEELEYAGRYLCALAQHGCRSFVSNAHATEVGVAILGGVMPVPLTRPAAGRTLARCSYTSSSFSHYVHYLFDEIWLLARGRIKVAGPGQDPRSTSLPVLSPCSEEVTLFGAPRLWR